MGTIRGAGLVFGDSPSVTRYYSGGDAHRFK